MPGRERGKGQTITTSSISYEATCQSVLPLPPGEPPGHTSTGIWWHGGWKNEMRDGENGRWGAWQVGWLNACDVGWGKLAE